MKVVILNSTLEGINDASVNEARKNLASILSYAERRDDSSKANPELGKAAIDVKNINNDVKTNVINNGAVDFCKQVLGESKKPTDPVESTKKIGNMLADLRKAKTNEVP